MENNDETKKMTEKEVIECLAKCMDKQEFVNKMKASGWDEDAANLVYVAYNKGIGEYIGKYYEEQSRADENANKYTSLAIRFAEKMLSD